MNVKGYKKLSDEQRELFNSTYKRHLSCLGTELRKQYEPSQLKEIKWDRKDRCLKVYWKNDWLHYLPNGTWF